MTRTRGPTSRPAQGPDTEVIPAADSRRDTSPLEPAGRGRCAWSRWCSSSATIRVAAWSSRACGSRPSRTAATIPSRAARGSGGISSTSSPARSARTADPALPNRPATAAICSESVNATPRKPSSSRSSPVTTAWDSDEGVRGSTARTSRCPTITEEVPTSTAARNGTRSRARSSASDRRWTGSP